MKIPYVNLSLQHTPIKKEILQAISTVIDKGDFVLGDGIKEFEEKFAKLCGVKYAVGVNSGTDALIFALKAIGIKSGDQVITVANSFMTTTSAIVLAGAKPVFVDVERDYMMDSVQIEKHISKKTKVIMPVHLTGKPADMNSIIPVARKHNIKIIEDCAQAVSAEYHGKKVGSFGEVGCFSLHPLKTLNACGDGGVITTNDKTVCEKVRIYRNNGFINRDTCTVWSSNSRLDTLQAKLLLVKLKYLERWTKKRIENAKYYIKHLTGIPQIQLPQINLNERSVFHTFVIQADNRDALRDFLISQGIETKIHYPIPIHLQPVANGLKYKKGSLSETERQSRRIVSLPIYPELTTKQLAYIAHNIKKFYGIHR